MSNAVLCCRAASWDTRNGNGARVLCAHSSGGGGCTIMPGVCVGAGMIVQRALNPYSPSKTKRGSHAHSGHDREGCHAVPLRHGVDKLVHRACHVAEAYS